MYVTYPVLGLELICGYLNGSLVMCGGGGSAKTGIMNLVDAYAIGDVDRGEKLLSKVTEFDTGSELACTVRASPDGSMLAVSVGPTCWLLSYSPTALDVLIKFRTDFAVIDESEQTVAVFAGDSMLITGGMEGVIRIWRIGQRTNDSAQTAAALDYNVASREVHVKQPSIGDSAVQGNTQVTLLAEYRGHHSGKQIKALAVDDFSRNLVASSAEDGSCHLWRLTDYKAFCKLNVEDFVGELPRHPKAVNGVPPPRLQFRCLRYAPDPKMLYAVLSPPRGYSYLLQLSPRIEKPPGNREWYWRVSKAVVLYDEPVSCLAVSCDGRFVAVGSANGHMKVLSGGTLEVHMVPPPHTYAVTGIVLIPRYLPERTYGTTNKTEQEEIMLDPVNPVLLVSASADKCVLACMISTVAERDFGTQVASFFLNVARVLTAFGFSVTNAICFLVLSLLILHTTMGTLPRSPLDGVDGLLHGDIKSPNVHATVCAGGASALFFAFCLAVLMWQATSIRKIWAVGFLLHSSVALVLVVAIALSQPVQWKIPGAMDERLIGYVLGIAGGVFSFLTLFLHVIFNAIAN